MHLIFERSNGRFKSNCNILSLAWMPYYNETKFRQALFDYHQRQLMNISNPNHPRRRQQQLQPHQGERHEEGPNIGAIRQLNSRQRVDSFEASGSNRPTNGDDSLDTNGTDRRHNDNQPGDEVATAERSLSSRLTEQYQRYNLMKNGPQSIRLDRRQPHHQQQQHHHHHQQQHNSPSNNESSQLVTPLVSQLDNISTMNNELDSKYGRLPDFGWLAVGNVGKLIGITLTSVVAPPIEIDGRQEPKVSGEQNVKKNEDLIVLDDDGDDENPISDTTSDECKAQSRQHFSSSDYERIRPDKKSSRTNYNLRGHLDEIVIVQWNELYQKLATVDSKGNVLIWCKVNEKFTIQTPFYNRTKSVADFKWSNDGKTALICYTDSFILVGSSSGQRHWHSMLNLEDYHITCASWTPNDEQLLFGVSNGNIVIIDLPRSELTELVVSQVNIRTMCWSSNGLNLRDLAKMPKSAANDDHDGGHGDSSPPIGRRNSVVVNYRRLSRDCSVFSRFRLCSQAPNAAQQVAFNSSCPPTTNNGRSFQGGGGRTGVSWLPPSNGACSPLQESILAIDFADNTIRLYVGGLSGEDYEHPKQIQVNLESYIMSWSGDGQTLAVAGFNIHTSAPFIGCLRCRYMNVIKFYNRRGKLIHEHKMQYSHYPITAFTWAHEDDRIFVATGPRLHCAQVVAGLPSLALLSLSCIQKHTKLADKVDVLENLLLRGHFSFNVLNWQSFNCPLEIPWKGAEVENAKLNEKRSNFRGQHKQPLPQYVNNTNVSRLHMHAKLGVKLDALFAQTIRQPFDDQFSLNDVVWHVPKNNQRHYCTLICYTSELIDSNGSSAMGQQYRTDQMERNLDNEHANSGTSDQYKIFVLYVEFQGSLIPILKARRIGFLKPEFVIFDPEESPVRNLLVQRQQQKVSDVDFRHQRLKGPEYVSNLAACPMHSNELNAFFQMNSNCIGLHENSLYEVDKIETTKRQFQPNIPDKSTELLARRNRGESQHVESKHNRSLLGQSNAIMSDPTRYALERSRRLASIRPTSSNRQLSETNELVRIRSNVWGTKFKLIYVGNRMIQQRSVRLGSVEYKASILHLQPRQICLNIKDLSNYCVLCSSHHHSSKHCSRRQAQTAYRPRAMNAAHRDRLAASGTSSIDLPLNSSRNPRPPLSPRSSLKADSTLMLSSRHRNGIGSPSDHNKVLLAVGDSIKIAPKLELNQRYKLQTKSLSSTTRTHESKSVDVKSKRKARYVPDVAQSFKGNPNGSNGNQPLQSRASSSLGFSSCISSTNNIGDDDILTLSLGQGDQVRVEMSSLNSAESGLEPRASTSKTGALAPKMDEFLEANKTLKSIQTITKMIVDLSSKAHTEMVDDYDNDKQMVEKSSPNKLLKTKRHTDVSLSSAKQYIPPEAPVHRPRHRDRPILEPGGLYTSTTQSATSTPLRNIPQRRRRRASQRESRDGDCNSFEHLATAELPPPPPSVPFGRRLSSSAKRFFDGSLRSLTGVSGYSTATDADDCEGCEPLLASNSSRLGHRVMLRPSSRQDNYKYLNKPSRGRLEKKYASQPSTPTMRSHSDASQLSNHKQHHKNALDLSQLKIQLLQKLRDSTKKWRSSETELNLEPLGSSRKSRWMHQKRLNWGSADKYLDYSTSSSSSSSSSISIKGDNDEHSNRFSSSDSISSSGSADQDHSLLYGTSKRGEHDQRCDEQSHWPSARNLSRNIGASLLDDDRKLAGKRSRRSDAGKPPTTSSNNGQKKQQYNGREQKRSSRKRGRSRRSICANSNCFCAREFKLNNRPPVWNEQSQVYQLDFSGRVTQESAKNLQIDFEGNLALQFGRIDRCTYTLDYKYPFNAVQAMAVALASLTQRLK